MAIYVLLFVLIILIVILAKYKLKLGSGELPIKNSRYMISDGAETIKHMKKLYKEYKNHKDSFLRQVVLNACDNVIEDCKYELRIMQEIVDNKLNVIVGPVSCYTLNFAGRDIVLFGDIHDNFRNDVIHGKYLYERYDQIKEMYLKDKYKLSTIYEPHNDTIYTIDEYLYMLANSDTECLDLYLESHLELHNEVENKLFVDSPMFMSLVRLMFIPCNKIFIDKPEKYNECDFKSIRLHQIDIRMTEDNIASVIKAYYGGNDNKIFDELYEFMNGKDVKYSSNAEHLRKAYNKSIFKNDKKIYDCYVNAIQYHRARLNEETMLLTALTDLYMFYRMTVKEWADDKINRARVTKTCKQSKAPKNVIIYMGDLHIKILVRMFELYGVSVRNEYTRGRITIFDGPLPFRF